MSRIETAFLFDLDGTLVDSVYQHVLAWREALDHEGIDLSVWRIHRRIGMSGALFTNMLLRETGLAISSELVERLRERHAEAYTRHRHQVRPLPGARELLNYLTEIGNPWAVATSGRMETAKLNLDALGIDPAVVPVVTRDQVKYAKPDPDLFLAAVDRLGAKIEHSVVIGDSIWDMLAAHRARPLALDYCPAVTGRRNSSVLVPHGFTKIPPTCSGILMKSVVVAKSIVAPEESTAR